MSKGRQKSAKNTQMRLKRTHPFFTNIYQTEVQSLPGEALFKIFTHHKSNMSGDFPNFAAFFHKTE